MDSLKKRDCYCGVPLYVLSHKFPSTRTTSHVRSRVREKQDLQELNDRFATYIERVRFLEADNKRLHDILNKLKEKFEELERVLKAMYEEELAAARKVGLM